jgi:TRAP-type C4-dicarboxylate transport system substrate-binding protein
MNQLGYGYFKKEERAVKKLFLIPLIIVLAASLVFGGCDKPTTPAEPTTPAPAPMEVLFNDAQWSPTSPPGLLFKWFTDEVTKRTDGRLVFTHVGSNSLTKPGEEIDAIQSGLVDVGNTCVVYHPGALSLNTGFMRTVPFGINDLPTGMELAYKMYYEEPSPLVDEYANLGLTFLFVTIDSAYVIESKTPIMKLEDLDGQKVACLGKYGPMWLKAVGATSVALPVGERPTAIQTGVVEAAATPLEISFPFKLFEFAPNIIGTRWGIVTGNPISWNTEKFNALPADIQSIIIETGKEAFMHNLEIVEAWEADALKTIAEAGATIHPDFSDADIATWAGLISEQYGDPVAGWVKDAEEKGTVGAAEVAEKWLRLQKEAGHEFPIEWKAK